MRKNDIIEITIKGIDFPSKPYGYYENDERKFYSNINVAVGQKIRGRVGKIKNTKVELRDIEIIDDLNKKPFCDKFNKFLN